ncbi:flagellin N-terminal helical domain-containing protein [Acutalibacter sp. 1XD8-36]|uniref:flagellin N-terminal helical domain-containing protein n=1 Tax=Acutalibacter sp. 1XD8-36 TaxID=2320852 RepID=UPI002626808F|nr:flagellin [Acutalibacter sp. 1XD8-36]
MRIQHNIMSMNAYRNYNNNASALSKNLEKLSSGYKINRAGDDAAGLAISEKMRAQIKGLEAAQKNVKDGISLVKTAEGAMQEIQDMLSRMKYLATQSSNGTYDDEVDRKALQDEVDQLNSEINRIADSANFNGTKLLDGSLSATGGSAGANSVKFSYNVTTTDTTATKGKYTLGAAAAATIANTEKVGSRVEYTFTYRETADGADKTATFGFTLGEDAKGNKILVSDSGREYDIADWDNDGVTATDIDKALGTELKASKLNDKFNMTTTSGAAFVFEAREQGSAGAVMVGATERTIPNSGTLTASGMGDVVVTTAAADVYKELQASGVTAYDGTNAEKAIFSINGNKYVLADAGTDTTGLDKNVTVLTGTAFTADHANVIAKDTGLTVNFAGGKLTFKPGTSIAGKGGLQLQIGDTSDNFNQLNVVVGDLHAKAIGVASVNISTIDGATAAIDDIKNAINTVSAIRGKLGATQNRLEHTANNLSVMTENIQDAESTIRDTDVADEMMAYTKNNILIQSAQAMLAQANAVPQGVLQLLQ